MLPFIIHHRIFHRLTHASSTTTPFTSTLPPLPSTTTTTAPAPADAHLAVSSTDLAVGELVTVTGTGCPVGHWGEPDVDPDRVPAIVNTTSGHLGEETWFLTSTGDSAGGSVGRDGRWTTSGTVPMVPPGRAELVGLCAPSQSRDRGAQIEFHYPGVSVTVASSFRLEVEPGTTVKPGARLTVNPFGGECPYLSGSSPEVHLYSTLDVSLSEGEVYPVQTAERMEVRSSGAAGAETGATTPSKPTARTTSVAFRARTAQSSSRFLWRIRRPFTQKVTRRLSDPRTARDPVAHLEDVESVSGNVGRLVIPGRRGSVIL